MNLKISFHHMPRSAALEEHAREKLARIQALFKHADPTQPLFIELFLHAETSHHAHHSVEMRLKSGPYSLSTHDQGDDMYVALEQAIDKMVNVLKKEKAKSGDKKHRIQTAKTAFAS